MTLLLSDELDLKFLSLNQGLLPSRVKSCIERAVKTKHRILYSVLCF